VERVQSSGSCLTVRAVLAHLSARRLTDAPTRVASICSSTSLALSVCSHHTCAAFAHHQGSLRRSIDALAGHADPRHCCSCKLLRRGAACTPSKKSGGALPTSRTIDGWTMKQSPFTGMPHNLDPASLTCMYQEGKQWLGLVHTTFTLKVSKRNNMWNHLRDIGAQGPTHHTSVTQCSKQVGVDRLRCCA